MKPINGVYVGWIPPHGSQWEPLYRTVRCSGGYKSEKTNSYEPTITRYPGLTRVLDFKPNPLALPYALNRRTPKVRPDYERDSHLFDLSYPNLDLFEYIGRTGGLFAGDPFTVCPIVVPNDDGNYTYECELWNVDPDVRDHITENTQLGISPEVDKATSVTADGLYLGRLSPHFTMLSDSVFNLNIVRIKGAENYTGSQIIVSFNTPVNLYTTPAFTVVSEEVIVNV